MGVQFDDLRSQEGLKKLDQYLHTRSYITGHQASRDDLAVFAALKNGVPAELVNASRWYKHIAALAGPRFSDAGVGVHIDSGAAPAAASRDVAPPAAPQTPAATAETPAGDDDDLDLFGEETEEEKAAAEEREASKKAAAGAKKKESGKSSVLLDVKPWDDETDMVKLEEVVRAVHMDGLHWGASKLVTVVAGIKKLSIMMTIVDDLVSVDNLIEDHLTSEPNNEYIQSCDILAFNKICKFSLPYILICILTNRIDLGLGSKRPVLVISLLLFICGRNHVVERACVYIMHQVVNQYRRNFNARHEDLVW